VLAFQQNDIIMLNVGRYKKTCLWYDLNYKRFSQARSFLQKLSHVLLFLSLYFVAAVMANKDLYNWQHAVTSHYYQITYKFLMSFLSNDTRLPYRSFNNTAMNSN